VNLNDRKLRILEAIITDYIQTAEPIGSRTIAKKYDLGISSATIRNEMSDLEDMGLIVQPHISSGRAPSDKGYRLYVDSMMRKRDLTQDETMRLQQAFLSRVNQVDHIMRDMARIISVMTKYTTIVSELQLDRTRVKHVQLVPLDENSVVMMLITDNNVIKNKIIHVREAPDYKRLNELSEVLNDTLTGLMFDEIDDKLVKKIMARVNEGNKILAPALSAILNLIKDDEDVKFYTSGVKNILAFPEFSDIDKARSVFNALEEKDMLITLLGQDETDNVQVVIGSENSLEQLRDCSIIRTKMNIGGHYSSIGIIGPTRMNYSQVVSLLNGVVKNIRAALKSLTGG
jgi:heat-inducible transcriptional repressor